MRYTLTHWTFCGNVRSLWHEEQSSVEGWESRAPDLWHVAQLILLRTCCEWEKFKGWRIAEDQRKYANIPARTANTIPVVRSTFRIVRLYLQLLRQKEVPCAKETARPRGNGSLYVRAG